MAVQITVESALFGLFGGFLIAIATSINLFLKGRITGMSGMFYSLITLDFASGFLWKTAAFLGLVSSVSIYNLRWSTGEVIANIQIFDTQGQITAGLNYVGFGIAGYLVGFGTKMGNGCTSGHGVCGLPRFSIRSFVAVGCFLTTSISIATLRYYVPFLSETQTVSQEKNTDFQACSVAILVISLMIIGALLYKLWTETKKFQDVWVGYIVGFFFGTGLAFSGMTRRSKIIGFLTMYSEWDPTLMFVLGGAVGLNLLTFYYIMNKAKKPLLGEKLEIPTNKVIDRRLIIGSSVFGLGWGLGGLCPGPALAMYSAFTFQIGIVWMVFLGLGQLTVTKLEQFISSLKAKDAQPSSQKIQPQNKIEVQKGQAEGQTQGQPPVQTSKQNQQNQENNQEVRGNHIPHVHLPKIENIDHQHELEVLNKKGQPGIENCLSSEIKLNQMS